MPRLTDTSLEHETGGLGPISFFSEVLVLKAEKCLWRHLVGQVGFGGIITRISIYLTKSPGMYCADPRPVLRPQFQCEFKTHLLLHHALVFFPLF